MRRLLFLLVAAFSAVVLGLLFAGAWLRSELESPYYSGAAEGTFVNIPAGSSTNEVARLLANAKILHTELPFRVYMRFTGNSRRIQAGEYRFSEPATPRHVAQRLVHGDVYFRSVTIPEGLTARETVELLAEKGLGNRAELEQALLRTDWIRDLDPGAKNLEGYLFPETYRFGHKAGPEDVIHAMVQQFRSRYSRIAAQSPAHARLSVPQIVILASLIEKEVKDPAEGPLVASVLANRLERKIPLACDATIIYAMKLAGTYRGRLGKADLQMASPYNSYLHNGLPPGPIANPGARSIRDALNPAETDYLYYVSRNDGTHQFSTNYTSHINAVNRYQKSLAVRRISQGKSAR